MIFTPKNNVHFPQPKWGTKKYQRGVLHPAGFWHAAGGVAPTVSALADGDVNTSVISARYVGVKFDTDGEEYELVGNSSTNYGATVGTWLDTGTSDQVWVQFNRTSGSTKFQNRSNSTRYNIASDVSFYGQDLDIGSPQFTITGTFSFYDAASGGNLLQTTASATWRASYFDSCPGCCFTPWTLITLADGSKMPIVDVMVGDLIRVEGGIEAVSEIITRESRVMYTINFADGRLLEASEDHPLYVDGKGYAAINPEATIDYKYVGVDVTQLLTGDKVLDQDGNLNEITSIVGMHYPKTVYTFGNAKFFANGLLVY